ncbi:MAG: hypothetical protein IT552_15630 [Sphingomonadaceae bacterium]|jgi:hypothetical protein|nr:hypothetical protein [Sphingomonadaceae bacterium]
MSEWISSLQAVLRLRDAGLNAPETTLGLWAEAGFVKSRAKWGRFSHDGGTDEIPFPDEPPADQDGLEVQTPWPDIPNDFWHYVNTKNGNSEAHYEAGIFAARVVLDPEIGTYSDTEHIKLYGVSFHSDNLEAMLNGVGERQAQVQLPKSPSSNRGRKTDQDRWAEFGAALAFFAQNASNAEWRSTHSVYQTVSSLLVQSNREPFTERVVRPMIDMARAWIEADNILERPEE